MRCPSAHDPTLINSHKQYLSSRPKSSKSGQPQSALILPLEAPAIMKQLQPQQHSNAMKAKQAMHMLNIAVILSRLSSIDPESNSISTQVYSSLHLLILANLLLLPRLSSPASFILARLVSMMGPMIIQQNLAQKAHPASSGKLSSGSPLTIMQPVRQVVAQQRSEQRTAMAIPQRPTCPSCPVTSIQIAANSIAMSRVS